MTPLWRRYLRFWGPDPAADVDDEFAFHLEKRIEELHAQGLSPQAARDEALRRFGDIHHVKRICRTLAEERERAMRRTQWWSDWRHDLRFAARQLTVSPLLSVVLVLTTALGIGSTVAIFSVLNAVLLRPLPWADGDRLVFVYETWRQFRTGSASVGHFHDWTEQGTVFDHTAAMTRATFNLADGGEPERVIGARVTPGYFRVLNIPPTAGRVFTEDDLAGDARVVVVSQGLWRRRFAGDRSLVGRTISLNGQAHTVVGIAAPENNMTQFAPQLWTPLVFTTEQRANYGSHSYTVIGKLKAGITRDAAQADMERVTRGIAVRQPREMEGRSVNVQRYDDVLLGGFRTPGCVMLAAVVIVLLIGCANVVNLLLARATTRRREISIRAAIGGGRWRILRQLLTESVVLAIVSGITGVGLAALGIPLLVRYGPRAVPRLQDAGLHPEVLWFALGLTLLTGVVVGLAPAIRASRGNLATMLRDGGRSSLAAVGRDRLRGALVVCEIAVAVVLLVGAGLFIRSAWRLQQVPLGFDTQGVLSARVALTPRYATDDAVADAYRRILEHTRAVPGVEHAGASTGVPLIGGGPDASMQVEGKPFDLGTAPSPAIRLVTDGYLEAIGMRLMRGRTMRAEDTMSGAPPVAVINERLASLAWPGEDPIGRRLSTWTRAPDIPEWREVVGIVGDVRSLGPDTPPMPELFLPYTQPPPMAWAAFQRSMALVVRTSNDPAAYASSLRGAVRSVDASLPLYDVLTMEDAIGADLASARFSTWLLSLLAIAGLVLAAVGVYGVIAYFVTQRTSEIGLRLALGATPGSVLVMVMRHGAILAVAGIAIGLVASLAATRLVETLLFEVSPTDTPTYVAGGLVLFAIALLACAVPAARAVRVNPMRSLAES
jgi:predicted permease